VSSQYGEHVESPSSYLIVTMMRSGVCLHRLLLESLSTSKNK